MADAARLVQHIVIETISFVQALFVAHSPKTDEAHEKAKAALSNILRLCKNFLLILDDQKAVAYKLAIANEFFEFIRDETAVGLVTGFDNLDHNIHSLQEYIHSIHNDQTKQEILLAQITAGLNHFIDPHSIHPPTVVFWLKEHCTAHALKKMQALLLFLNKQDHAKILQHDSTLLQDHNVQFLLECVQDI